MAPHVEHHKFTCFQEFQLFMQRTAHLWANQVDCAVRLMALNGIQDPLSGDHIPASALQMDSRNYRETFRANQCLARHRAVLLILAELIRTGLTPPQESLDIYTPEAITPFASVLRQHFPRWFGSEYLPEAGDSQERQIQHQDLCALTLADSCADVVICNELFEHVYDLPASLAEISRILRPGGTLISTYPFAYNRQDSIIKVRHRPNSTPGVAEQEELLMEAEYHGDPVRPNLGSLVYQIPGWDLLDQARSCGLEQSVIHWVAAPSYGVVGQEIPGVMALVASKSSP